MNKTEFVGLLSKKLNCSKKLCNNFIDEFKNLIIEVLSKGENVSIKNFGKFKIVETKAKQCINPITKRRYFSTPKKMAIFKSFKNFKLCLMKK